MRMTRGKLFAGALALLALIFFLSLFFIDRRDAANLASGPVDGEAALTGEAKSASGPGDDVSAARESIDFVRAGALLNEGFKQFRALETARYTEQAAQIVCQGIGIFAGADASGQKERGAEKSGRLADPLIDPDKGAGEPTDDGTEGVHKGTVARGDTLANILGQTSDGNVQHYLGAAAKVFSLRSFREGQPFVVVTDAASGRIKRFEYEIDGRRRLVVEGEDQPRASLEEIEYTTLLDVADGVITDNLFQAVADIGESPQLALKLVDLFGSEINFIKDMQPGDSFTVLLEKRYRDGEYKGYGRIMGASFTNRGKTYEAYLFRDGGKAEYFNARGENLHKTLLQSPLAFTRITSSFTHSRKHPILKTHRPHLGVDYGAPHGTPVKAVGDGEVTQLGWAGGYGNQIVLKHSAGLESMYAHLSGFARGLRKGQRVRQGQVIGFVGSTGMSTGPHLDFRLRQKGVFINPVKAINPRGAPVSAGRMQAFKNTANLVQEFIRGKRPLADYRIDSLVSPIVPSESGKTVANAPAAKKQAKKNLRNNMKKVAPGKKTASGQARKQKNGTRKQKKK